METKEYERDDIQNTNDILQIYKRELDKPILDYDKQRQMLIKIKTIKENETEEEKKEREKTKEEFIKGNLRLVIPIARKYMGRGLDLIDLIQEGNIGLIKAINKFDITRENRFSTYATIWIKQQINRAIDDLGKGVRTPTHFNEQIEKIKKVETMLLQKDGEKPTRKKLAKALGLKEKQLENILQLNRQCVSLNSSTNLDDEDSDELGDFIESDEKSPENIVIEENLSTEVNKLLNILSERERNIIKLRYGLEGGEKETLESIGSKYGVTRERIRQIEAKALNKLRNSKKAEILQGYVSEKTLKLTK